jgi:hypothetical protein
LPSVIYLYGGVGLSISSIRFDYQVEPDGLFSATQVELGRERLVSQGGDLEVDVGRAARVDAGR